MSEPEVRLLDVVPWTHGYAHSWALAWMLQHDPDARDALLGLFLPKGRAPWIVEVIDREYRVGRNRADLKVEASDATGHHRTLLVETKVNDDLKDAQIEAYCEASEDVVVYGPGLTGLLHSGADPIGHERWLTGAELAEALADVRLPSLLQSYVDDVRAESERMQAARACVRGEIDDFPRELARYASGEDVEAVAWVAEVASGLRARGASEVLARNTAHDYGVFWAGSWRTIGSNEAGLYVDVIAAHGGWEYVVTVKAGGGAAEDRQRMVEAIAGASPGEEWDRGRRSSRESFRVWKLNASEMSSTEATDAAWHAWRWIAGLS